jgi:hypothetical protein
MKKVEPGAVGRQATWKRRRDDLPKVHSTEKETDRYGGSTCNYRPSRVRKFEEIVLHNIWVWRHLNGPRRNDSTASSHLHTAHFPYLSQVPE